MLAPPEVPIHIQTVSGPVEPERLGATLMHEHIDSVVPGGFYSSGNSDDDLIERAFSGLGDHGIGAVVDLTGRSRVLGGHDLSREHRLAARLPLHLVLGFSFYKDPWLEAAGDATIDRLTAIYIDAATGESRGIKAGIFGEVGTSLDEITPREEAHLRAVARAHTETGLGVTTHCTLGTMAPEQVAVLTEEGVDVDRVVIGHLDLRPDIEYLERVLAAGVTIGFDTFGKEWFDYRVPGSENHGGGEFVKWSYYRSDDDRVAALAELCRRGHADRIVLSCDMSGAEAWLNPATHGRFGYSYLSRVVLPRLREAGVTESALHRMLVENPARILAVP